MLYFISSTLNIVLFGQAPPKPYQNHHLDPISLPMDGSGLFKPGSGSETLILGCGIWTEGPAKS